MAQWTAEQKAAALMIAEATSISEASRRTGIPEGTIKRWRSEGRSADGEPNSPNRTEPVSAAKIREAVLAEATTKAVEMAADAIADRLTKLADRLYTLADGAVDKVAVAISAKGEPHDRNGAAWVRALVGVMAQALDKAQLLTGKPTSRQAVEGQVTERHEYDVTHRVEQYADVYRRLADRMGCGSVCGGDAGDHNRESVDTR